MSLRQKKRMQTEATILDAARALCQGDNWSAISTRDIAAKAGISYQTLYNYFPSKAAIIQALIVSTYIGPEQTFQSIIKRYQGNLLESLRELNQARLALVREKDPEWWVSLNRYFSRFEPGTSEVSHLVNLVDKSGDAYFYALLRTAQGVGDLQPNVDIQLMAHSLHSLSNSAFERLVAGGGSTPEAILEQQTRQLVAPYLAV